MLERYSIVLLGEGTFFIGFLIWLFSDLCCKRKSIYISTSLVLTHFFAYLCLALSPIKPGVYSTILLLSIFQDPRVYYWDAITAAILFMNVSVVFMLHLYNLSTASSYDQDVPGLFWMSLGALNILFLTSHALLFFIAFEGVLIPLGLWILKERSQKSFTALRQLIMYTASGSIFLLFGLLVLHVGQAERSWFFSDLSVVFSPSVLPFFLSLSFLLPFFIKLPIWPLHGWLPLAHTQAPTQASVILASSVLKMGGYGLLRVLPVLQQSAQPLWGDYIIILGLLTIFLPSMSAFHQQYWKKIIAYSSIVHMGWIVVAIGLLLKGSYDVRWLTEAIVLEMVAHGMISMGLFLILGMLYERTQHKNLEYYEGMSDALPQISRYLVFFSLANMSLPTTAGFVPEFMIGSILFEYSPILTLLALGALILTTLYNLRYLNIFLFDKRESKKSFYGLADCSLEEHQLLLSLIGLIMILGVFPGSLLKWWGF